MDIRDSSFSFCISTWNPTDGSSNHALVVQLSCPALCDPMDCSPPHSSVRGILQARILEWVAISSSRGSSWPRDWTWVSHIAFFTVWATGEAWQSTMLTCRAAVSYGSIYCIFANVCILYHISETFDFLTMIKAIVRVWKAKKGLKEQMKVPSPQQQRRQRHPTPVLLPGKSHGRRSLVGCRLWGRTVGHDWGSLAAAAAMVFLHSNYSITGALWSLLDTGFGVW